jgi:hypothetical protein
VTFHKATFNKINDLRGGGLQAEIGRRERLRIENAENVYVLPPLPHGIDVLCNHIRSRVQVAELIAGNQTQK